MSEALLFANNALTTVASSLSSGGTTLSVATGTGALFPAPGAGQYFVVSLFNQSTGAITEICWCTAVTGDNLTIVRAKEGTAALSWSVGDIVQVGPTAGQMQALAQLGDLQSQSGNYAADTGTANAMVITLSPVPASLTALIGVPIRILKSNVANTDSVTLTVNSLATKAVTLPPTVALSAANGLAGRLPANGILEVAYDGTQFQLLSGPGASGATPGSYTNANITIDDEGRVKAATNGTGGVFTAKFTSTNTTISANVSFANHGLGAVPFGWSASLICTTNNAGFVVGQEIALPATTNNGVSGGSSPFGTISVYADSGAVYCSYDTSNTGTATGFWVANATTGARVQITPADWAFIFRAWL